MIRAHKTTPLQFKAVGYPHKVPAAIHLDLDGCAHIYRIHGWKYEAQDDPLFETGLQHALDFFDKAKVRATLFVIAEDLHNPYKRELIKEAVKRGHEIASHSLTHRRLTTLDRDDKRREIWESRERITAELGVEVQGFRAPGFSIDQESLEIVDAAGYTYDSSLFPSTRLSRRIGLANVSPFPHCPFEHRSLVEFPLPLRKPLPLHFHPCYSLVLGIWYFRLGLRRFLQTGAPLVLLFHLTDLADPLPDDRLPNWKARLYTLSHLSSGRKRSLCQQMLDLVDHQYKLVDTLSLLTMYSMMPKTSGRNYSDEGYCTKS